MEWHIGQKVVCINNKRISGNTATGTLPPLVEDKIYTISGLNSCSCGALSLDVGLRSGIRNMICTKCKSYTARNTPIHWASEKRFLPLDEWIEMESLVKQLTEPKEELV